MQIAVSARKHEFDQAAETPQGHQAHQAGHPPGTTERELRRPADGA